MSNLTPMTPEERAVALAKAAETKQQAIDYANVNQRKPSQDDLHTWQRLASEHGVRLPVWYLMADPKQIRKVLKKLKISTEQFKENWGVSKFEDVLAKNPSMGAVEFMGLCLEDVSIGVYNPQM